MDDRQGRFLLVALQRSAPLAAVRRGALTRARAPFWAYTGTMSKEPPHASPEDARAMVTALLTASRLLVAVTARSIEAVDESLSLPQWRTLVVVDEAGQLSLSQLAAELEVQPSTAKRMVTRLEAHGLVVSGASSTDARASTILLTRKGVNVVRDVMALRTEKISAIVDRMPGNHWRELVVALERFAVAGDEPVAYLLPKGLRA